VLDDETLGHVVIDARNELDDQVAASAAAGAQGDIIGGVGHAVPGNIHEIAPAANLPRPARSSRRSRLSGAVNTNVGFRSALVAAAALAAFLRERKQERLRHDGVLTHVTTAGDSWSGLIVRFKHPEQARGGISAPLRQ
jgi:hypothetical protein